MYYMCDVKPWGGVCPTCDLSHCLWHAVVLMAHQRVHIACGGCCLACPYRLAGLYAARCVCTSGCFVLHAAIVPACVGQCAASCMAHWCQFFPMLVYAVRACRKQARTVVARVVC
jgi:hypothetical protein